MLIVCFGALLLFSADQIQSYYVKSKLDPPAELTKAIANMDGVEQYRYKMKSAFQVEDREEVISEVSGEKSNGKTHIKGEMVNTVVDIYYIDRTIYNYDSIANKWLVIDTEIKDIEGLMISELNPLTNFRFSNPNQVEKKGFETVDGAECLLVSCFPSDKTQLLETLWQDVGYFFWIDYKKGVFTRAQLFATNKKNPNTKLSIQLELFDINQEVVIEPPDLNRKN